MIIGITGLVLDRDGNPLWGEGAGKSTVADMLVKRGGFTAIGCADMFKRFARDLFDFTSEQVFGATEVKNLVDHRYGFSPRSALQKIGTEVGRHIREDVWIDYTLRATRQILEGRYYTAEMGLGGLAAQRPSGVAIHDVRFKNEIRAIKQAGGYVLRVRRPTGRPAEPTSHASMADLLDVPDREFDLVVQNDGDLATLGRHVDEAIEWIFDKKDMG